MARKIIGFTFIIAAIFGLILSAAGIILVWSVRTPITVNLTETLELLDSTLEATNAGLSIIDETIANSMSSLTTLESTVQNASDAIEDSVPLVETTTDLLSGSLSGAIEATQTGITTLQEAARTIESTLQLITSIPLLPVERYDPEVSFSDALDDISTSLDPIPQSLTELENTMNTTKGNLILTAAQVRIISRNIGDLNESLYEIKLIISHYQDVISEAQEMVSTVQNNINSITLAAAWFFTIIFIWLGIAQIGLFTQGLERVDWPRGQKIEHAAVENTVSEQLEDEHPSEDPQTDENNNS